MSTAPTSLVALAKAYTARGGVNLGIVGNAAHVAGYHLGRDRIFAASGQGWNDYSVKRERDKAGLTNEACGLDIGRLCGTLDNLQDFSNWLVAEAKAGRLNPYVREIIYSPDGKVVRRWESSTNTVYSGPGQGDLSHLTHTHISFYRDTVRQVPANLFAAYWARPFTITIKPNAIVRVATLSPVGCVLRWTDRTWGPTASSAPCTAPTVKRGCLGGSSTVVKVTAGVFAGKWVYVGTGVTVSPR